MHKPANVFPFCKLTPCSCKRGQTLSQVPSPAPVPVPMSLPVPDEGGQVAGELLLTGRDRGGPGPEGGEALPGMDTADALETGHGRNESKSLWIQFNPSITTQGTLSHPHSCSPLASLLRASTGRGELHLGFLFANELCVVCREHKQLLSLAGFLYLKGTREFLTSLSQSRSMSTGG